MTRKNTVIGQFTYKTLSLDLRSAKLGFSHPTITHQISLTKQQSLSLCLKILCNTPIIYLFMITFLDVSNSHIYFDMINNKYSLLHINEYMWFCDIFQCLIVCSCYRSNNYRQGQHIAPYTLPNKTWYLQVHFSASAAGVFNYIAIRRPLMRLLEFAAFVLPLCRFYEMHCVASNK